MRRRARARGQDRGAYVSGIRRNASTGSQSSARSGAPSLPPPPPGTRLRFDRHLVTAAAERNKSQRETWTTTTTTTTTATLQRRKFGTPHTSFFGTGVDYRVRQLVTPINQFLCYNNTNYVSIYEHESRGKSQRKPRSIARSAAEGEEVAMFKRALQGLFRINSDAFAGSLGRRISRQECRNFHNGFFSGCLLPSRTAAAPSGFARAGRPLCCSGASSSWDVVSRVSLVHQSRGIKIAKTRSKITQHQHPTPKKVRQKSPSILKHRFIMMERSHLMLDGRTKKERILLHHPMGTNKYRRKWSGNRKRRLQGLRPIYHKGIVREVSQTGREEVNRTQKEGAHHHHHHHHHHRSAPFLSLLQAIQRHFRNHRSIARHPSLAKLKNISLDLSRRAKYNRIDPSATVKTRIGGKGGILL